MTNQATVSSSSSNEGTLYDPPKSDVVGSRPPTIGKTSHFITAFVVMSVLVTLINFFGQYIIRSIAIRIFSSLSFNTVSIAWFSWFFTSLLVLFLSFFIFKWVVRRFILSKLTFNVAGA